LTGSLPLRLVNGQVGNEANIDTTNHLLPVAFFNYVFTEGVRRDATQSDGLLAGRDRVASRAAVNRAIVIRNRLQGSQPSADPIAIRVEIVG